MSRQIPTSIGLIAATTALLAWGAGVGIITIARAADCLTAPYFSAPEGSHWYYQTDRAIQRKCWFLRAKNQSSQQPTEQTASEGESATLTPAPEQPATASVGAATSIRPADSGAPRTSAQQGGPAPDADATNIAGADDCLTAPNSAAPAGKRWFYRTDRATQRKCWYLRGPSEATQRADAQAPSAPAKTRSARDNVTASADAPLVIPSPSLKLQPAPMSSTTTEDRVAQSAPAGNTSPSSRERPAAQTGAQAAAPAPDAGSTDAVAKANAAERNVAASDARADTLRPTVDARAREDAGGPARGGASTANAAGMAISLTGTLVQMFLIVAVGLGVASLLYRVVTAAARRRKISSDHNDDLEADWIGNQNSNNWPDNQQQYSVDEDLHRPPISGANEDQQHHRSVDERDQFTDDLHRSIIAAPTDRDDQQHQNSVNDRDPFIDDLRRTRRPHPTDDEWPNWVRGTGGASQIPDDVSARENTLGQLRCDLDRLLQQKSSDVDRFNDERERFIDDLHRSPVAGANDNGSGENDHDARRPANDEWSNNRRGPAGASHPTDEVSERDNRLAQLKRDLDVLLKSPKSA
jgi:hypothetical protein